MLCSRPKLRSPHPGQVSPSGTNSASGPVVPRVGPALGEDVGRALDHVGVEHRLPACLATQRRNGHAPRALPRDAPVRASGQHAADALLTPAGIPRDMRDGLERLSPKTARAGLGRRLGVRFRTHLDEPLRGGEEDDRAMASPAVGIRVLEVLAMPQNAPSRPAPPRPWDWPRRLAVPRRARPRRRSGRSVRPVHRCRGRSERRCDSRRRRVRARCARRRFPGRASRSRRARRGSRGRTADDGNAVPRGRVP